MFARRLSEIFHFVLPHFPVDLVRRPVGHVVPLLCPLAPRERERFRPRFGAPETRAQKSFGAVEKASLDVNTYDEKGVLASRRESPQQDGIARELDATVDAERFGRTG